MLNIENYEKLNILVIYIISKLCECGIVFYLFVYLYIYIVKLFLNIQAF